MKQIYHINASSDELLGNHGLGRYVFLTGSDERAREFSEQFHQPVVHKHPRQHNLYLGKIPGTHGFIDVASISSGIGGPSADIIINELIMLGARRLLRVGTAGSLQTERILVGDVVIATGAVRDDKASWDYIYREYPALASIEYVIAAKRAIAASTANLNTHFGVVHSKSSFYAREHQYSLLPENEQYMQSLRRAGVLATEMECAQLFILSALMGEKFRSASSKNNAILCGCILAIIGDRTPFSTNDEKIHTTIRAAIALSIETTKQLFLIDQQEKSVF